jgi:UDP-N-acetylmuramyl tripeptide synthase
VSGNLFGNDLTKQVELEGRTIPLLVERCIAAVELRGMDYEGIYRKSGGAAQMRSIQLSFEQGLDPDLTDDDEYNDICAVTSNTLENYPIHWLHMSSIQSS